MHLVGVDLAWGGRRPTGLAVLDDGGRLVHLSSAVSDRTILETLRPFTGGDVVVGFDAPLVVTNPTGRRPAEAALGADFARFDAGAHPVNTSRPGFEDTPRGARLAASLGLAVGGSSARRAVEVYPHPATVALFRLGRVLRYKQKPGRTLEVLRAELLRLTGLLEGLAHASPPLQVRESASWRALVERISAAGRKSELRPAEDEVDAVVCAYVALLVARAPERVTTYGDPGTGEILTPTLPPGHTPTPREPRDAGMPTAAASGPVVPVDPTRAAVDAYAARHPVVSAATEAFVAVVTGQLDDAGINYLSVTGRAKAVTSFAGKAARTRADGSPLYAEPLTEITDQVGLRVITYLHEDVEAVADLLTDEYVVLDDRDLGRETADDGRFGYASRHLLVASDERGASAPAGRALGGLAAQVQIRTVLQHAWAEFEHDIRYKGSVPPEHVSDLDRRFTLAAGLLELADREFSAIRGRLLSGPPEAPREDDTTEEDPRIATQDLASFLSGRFAGAGWSRTDHYEWIAGLLLELGITSLDELGGLLSSLDGDSIDARMGYRYPPGAVRRLDDALLAVYDDRYLRLHGNAHRVDLLAVRRERLLGEG
ncbi:MAG: DUF429 domain-containing protein [Actinomycetota bacterium]|nr:DUF429 domain-containing protein [Actinomycetota bacterium]